MLLHLAKVICVSGNAIKVDLHNKQKRKEVENAMSSLVKRFRSFFRRRSGEIASKFN